MDPKKYLNILKDIELNQIYLESCSAELKRRNIELHKNLQVIIRDRASFEQIKNKLKITQKFFLTVKTPEMKKDFAIKASVAFCLIYGTKTVVDKEFFDTYREVNLPLNTWPYLREYVQSITQRMNVPPLTLPLFKNI